MALEILEGSLTIPAIVQMADDIAKFVRNDWALRSIQSKNSPRAVFGQALILPGLLFVDSSGVYRLPQANSENNQFSFMTVLIYPASGAGCYRLDGVEPRSTGSVLDGIQIPAGGTILEIEGADNIRQFAIIANTGAQLTGWVQPFQ